MLANYLPPAHANDRRSAFEEIEKGSQELLAKSGTAQFVDKSRDSEEVAGLVEHFQETITHYQVSNSHSVRPCDSSNKIEIPTASDLRQNHGPLCECLSIL